MKTSISLEESLEPVDKFLFQISREFIAIYCFALMLMFIAARKQIQNAHNTDKCRNTVYLFLLLLRFLKTGKPAEETNVSL